MQDLGQSTMQDMGQSAMQDMGQSTVQPGRSRSVARIGEADMRIGQAPSMIDTADAVHQFIATMHARPAGADAAPTMASR